VIDTSDTVALRGWSCRSCGYANTLRVAGEIAGVAEAPLASSRPRTSAPGERRQNPRVVLTLTPLFGRRVGGGPTFVIEEASTSGFSIMSRSPYLPGTSYQFRIWSTEAQVTIVAAVCRSCTLLEQQPWLHRVGFQFLPQSARRLRVVLGAIATNAP
jgi:hypothetical protein